MEQEPEFCRDILETRIKLLFREYLKIARDIPFTHIYRFTTANADPNEVTKSLLLSTYYKVSMNTFKDCICDYMVFFIRFMNKNCPIKKI